MKKKILFFLALIFRALPGYCQDTQGLMEQAAGTYAGNAFSAGSLAGGFSVGGLIAGILFGSIGFVAFIYGKKNSEYKPMVIGILLMGYPYFIKSTVILYAAGTLLTAALFLWRD